MRSQPPARLHVFPDDDHFASDVARVGGLGLARIVVHRFPDGESLVRIRPPAGMHAVVVHSLHNPNAKLVETLMAADALRRAGAKRVTLVAPYLAYMRQDKVFAAGEPIAQRVIGDCSGRAFDGVLTVEAHLHRVHRLSDVISGHSRSISAAPVLAEWVQQHACDSMVVGPDVESGPWVREIARLANVPSLIGSKQRLKDRVVHIEFAATAEIRPHAVIVDDIASTGVTMAVAARALQQRGVESIDAVVVHAVFAAGAIDRIRANGVRRIVSCDTIPHSTNGISCAQLLAAPLAEVL